MNIVISGASGFIGRRLLKLLANDGHKLHVLSRHAGTNLPNGVRLSVWDAVNGLPPLDAFTDAGAVIHLAGEPVAQRWTAEARRRIRDSRILGTRHLVAALEQLPRKPDVLLAASAIGYYGDRGDEILTEDSPPGAGFLSEVCAAWEKEAATAETPGLRVTRLRIGVVLDPRGGALQRMLPPFRLALGGKLASGRQWMSWIHIEDLAALFRFALDHAAGPVVNAVAPNPVTNSHFTRELSAALSRPAIFPVPALALRAIFGEMAEVLLASQRVVPQAAQTAGFRFRFPQLADALADLLRK